MGGLSAFVTTVSTASADLLHNLGIVPKDKSIFIVPNRHEHALQWMPQNSSIPKRFALERPFVLLIGSSSPHKNIKIITSIARDLDNMGIDIVVAGGSFKVFTDKVKDDNEQNVRRLGYVTDDDLAYLLSKALCFVFPSLIEGFGIPLVEAMAWGCPIISSNTASMPEVCGEAAILVDPNRADEWLQAVSTLQQNAELRGNLADKGRFQMKKFSWRESARAYLRLIEAV